VNGVRVTILRILNEKHHQERKNRGASVNDQLPSIRELEVRSCYCP
jgi:hypothetical protein